MKINFSKHKGREGDTCHTARDKDVLFLFCFFISLHCFSMHTCCQDMGKVFVTSRKSGRHCSGFKNRSVALFLIIRVM